MPERRPALSFTAAQLARMSRLGITEALTLSEILALGPRFHALLLSTVRGYA